ncbi:hypothetical protein AOL_s00079g346 [Orbilia oligospora ATCC 24927]|uniref:F-box domain-containing protein n=1 Tax=Arthrobotrys oligospora (strain ATCC 24927 / CBS 115.81 / DSM 1491) TaxID=756982 RepID=G1XDG1_ARTOA|nr:hypothetical protein AOL_s00079g346 [Orbilia oligospora ATCC 24927]EGX48707.1 hypothetical protein AOL_s00079g346 [Orbilia oligospora ATCC 24927]
MDKTSMLTIPPELHISIFAFLGIGDLSRLVQTSKYFHRTAGHYLRRTIDFQTSDAIWKFQNGMPPDTVPIERAPFIQDDFFDFRYAFGLDYTTVDLDVDKNRDGDGPKKISVHKMDDFLTSVKEVITAKGLGIRDGDLYMSKPVIKNEQFRSIFRALKDLSSSRPASEFSITSITGQFNPTLLTQIFDTKKLTRLSISFKQIQWNSDPNTPEPSWRTKEDIIALKDLFNKSPNLEVLVLNPVMEIVDFRPLPEDVPALQELTRAFLTLKRLHTLDMRVYLFHPSYFIPVPEAVKTLSLYHVNLYSKAWWIEFSKFPFKNVENLEVFPSEEEFGYIFARDDYQLGNDRDGTLRTPEEIEIKGYKLGNVEIRSLKRFKFEDTEKLFLPRDLTLCVLKRNDRLDEQVKLDLMRQSGVTLDETRDRGGRRRSL